VFPYPRAFREIAAAQALSSVGYVDDQDLIALDIYAVALSWPRLIASQMLPAIL